MSFLLDANMVSEWVKPRPDPGVAAWLAEADEDRIHVRVAPMTSLDALVAVTCEVHGLALVTRDTRDFGGVVANVLDPWAVG